MLLPTIVRRLIAATLSAALASAVPGTLEAREQVSPPVTFDSPAGTRPAGPLSRTDAFARILPSGRIVRPLGRSVVTGMNALGVALSPGGRFAIVANCDEREGNVTSTLDPLTKGGYSLAVVDTQSMRVVDRYSAPDESFFVGVVALRDPVDPSNTLVLASGGPSDIVYAFDLDAAGHITPDARHLIAMPAALDEKSGNFGHAFPSTIVLSADNSHAFVVNNLGFNVAQIDTRTRTLAGPPVTTGFFPLGATLSPAGLVVLSEGLMNYGKLGAPVSAPPFGTPAEDTERASSLKLIGIAVDGGLAAASATLSLDRAPDGLQVVGGAHPAAAVALRSRPYAFVAMSNVDRVATVSLAGQPHADGGTELRLYDRGPYGTQPDALAVSKDERRLYVALAGINAIAVLDATEPAHLHRLGLIPTGWFPSALALSPDGRFLYAVNAKGISHDRGFEGSNPTATDANGRILQVGGDSNAVWSTLQRIDLARLDLHAATKAALSYLHVTRPIRPNDVVPQMMGKAPSSKIKHVVMILEENKTYDSMLGDLKTVAGKPYGPGDPSLVAFDASVTPNLHALARTYALAGNFFADAEESDAGHQFAMGGIASVFSERTLLVKSGRRPLVNKNEDPEDYPRAGYIFNSLALHHQSYRDYGDLVRVSGYDEGEAFDPKADDPNFVDPNDQDAPTRGLGGLYSLDVPAPLALANHVDLNYPGWNLRIRDVRRAKEFLADYDPIVKSGQMPAFTHIWLPADHGGFGPNIPALPEEVADGDRALGMLVEYFTHLPEWRSTAIIIMPDDAQSTRDHVNEHRSYAIVVSPYAKRHFVTMHHLSTVSALKTEEELLGLPALSLGDALAGDMADMFQSTPRITPYTRTDAAPQTASVEGRRIAALLADTDQSDADADSVRGARLIELSREADKLARRRSALAAAEYRRRQQALYRAALAVVRSAS